MLGQVMLWLVLAAALVGSRMWALRGARLLCDELERALGRQLTTDEREAIYRS